MADNNWPDAANTGSASQLKYTACSTILVEQANSTYWSVMLVLRLVDIDQVFRMKVYP